MWLRTSWDKVFAKDKFSMMKKMINVVIQSLAVSFSIL